MFVGKRDRLIKGNWKHGIVGLEDADSKEPSVFYSEDMSLKREL